MSVRTSSIMKPVKDSINPVNRNAFMYNRCIVIIIILLMTGNKVFAQSGNCAQNLQNAEKAFEEGTLRLIPELLTTCVDRGSFNKADKIRALKLLTIASLFMDNEDASDKAMVGLLRLNPELKVDKSNDPDEFIFMHSKYKTDAVFRYGAYVGVNNAIVNENENFGIYNFNSNTGVDYDGKFNLALGANFDYLVNAKIDISAEVGYSTRTYAIIGRPNYLGRYSIELEETQVWIDVPLIVRYNFFDNKPIVPYVYVGAAVNYLLAAKIGGDRTGDQTVTVGGIDIMNEGKLRNKINYSALVGLGARIKAKTDYFKLDARYVMGLTNLVNTANRFENQELSLNLGYIDNNLKLDYLQFSLGFVHSVFNPKRLKKYRRDK